MSGRRQRLVIAAGLVLVLTGCSYDYLQRTDKVGYSAGDAVKANLERETIDPANGSSYSTKGLGKDGPVVPADTVTAAEE